MASRHHPVVRHRRFAVAGVVILASGCSGSDSLASCDADPAASPRKALDAFDDPCADLRPDVVRGPYDGDKQSSRYASYAEVVEFTIERDNKTRFVLVGKEKAVSPWRVLTADGAEGTGP
jgi:hypothetical protein